MAATLGASASVRDIDFVLLFYVLRSQMRSSESSQPSFYSCSFLPTSSSSIGSCPVFPPGERRVASAASPGHSSLFTRRHKTLRMEDSGTHRADHAAARWEFIDGGRLRGAEGGGWAGYGIKDLKRDGGFGKGLWIGASDRV